MLQREVQQGGGGGVGDRRLLLPRGLSGKAFWVTRC